MLRNILSFDLTGIAKAMYLLFGLLIVAIVIPHQWQLHQVRKLKPGTSVDEVYACLGGPSQRFESCQQVQTSNYLLGMSYDFRSVLDGQRVGQAAEIPEFSGKAMWFPRWWASNGFLVCLEDGKVLNIYLGGT